MTTIIVCAVCSHDCPDTCTLLMIVQNGVVTKVGGDFNHPATAVGVLGTNASRYPLCTYHFLLMISLSARNFLNPISVNVMSLHNTEEERYLDMHFPDALRTASRMVAMCKMHNQRGSLIVKAPVINKLIYLIVGLSICWKKHAGNGKKANEVTNQRLTGMGCAPKFYDVLVQVEKEEASI